MYATCLFCHAPLGANEAIEHFPVGTRLAFDGARGRLWVVCAKCERWNLSPLEERWEAIEEAERAYRETKKRVTTDNVGLARLRDGTDLIRIGAALRPVFAAWRYGDTFGRRRNRRLLASASLVVAGAGVVGASAAGAIALGGASIAMAVLPQLGVRAWMKWMQRTARVTVVGNDGEVVGISRQALSFAHVQFLRLASDDPGQLMLSVIASDMKKPTKLFSFIDTAGRVQKFEHRGVSLTGVAAANALSKILPVSNGFAGSPEQVRDAVEIAAHSSSPYELLAGLSAEVRKQANERRSTAVPNSVFVSGLPPAVRLALEMSVHETAERRALEGELHELAHRWKEAEEIAAISDSLFNPAPSAE